MKQEGKTAFLGKSDKFLHFNKYLPKKPNSFNFLETSERIKHFLRIRWGT